jgi:hypothetical protein
MYNSCVKTAVLRTIFITILFLIVGCDYGMSIRQVNAPDRDPQGTDAQIIVSVETAQPLIGTRSYIAVGKLTNISGASITVSKVDLFAQNKTYEDEQPTQFTPFPLRMPPGGTERVGAYFRLDDDVYNTFQKLAYLRVYFRIGNEERVARVSIIGEEKGFKQLFHRH